MPFYSNQFESSLKMCGDITISIVFCIKNRRSPEMLLEFDMRGRMMYVMAFLPYQGNNKAYTEGRLERNVVEYSKEVVALWAK